VWMEYKSVLYTLMSAASLTASKLALSPWVALECCVGSEDVFDTWVCHSPESCGCHWAGALEQLLLQPRGCKDMGDVARIALYAPSTLAPYLSLPKTYGGSTGYISTTTRNGTATWLSTVIPKCTTSKHFQDKALLTDSLARYTETYYFFNGLWSPTFRACHALSGRVPSTKHCWRRRKDRNRWSV
jgi:hypothetical protein